MSRTLRLLLAALGALLLAPAAAQAHAVLEASTPERGAQLDTAPKQVTFRFNERVEASFGAVRVYDAEGERVDDEQLIRPPDDNRKVGVGLKGALEDGTYTATYRVVSADSHPVSGGLVFTVGSGGAAPSATVSELLSDTDSGRVTTTAFGVVRGLGYAAIAIGIGALTFLLLVWPRGRWAEADAALHAGLRRLVLGAAGVGAATALLSIVFQGAIAGGTSFWDALNGTVLGDVLDTRYGEVAIVRFVAWLAVGAAFAVALAPGTLALASAALLAAAVSFGLGGHAGATDPEWLLLPADALHVLAMGAWIGGLVVLLFVVPKATRALSVGGDRTKLLAATLTRFSPLALASVATIIASGTIQAIVHLDAFGDLVDTAFGRAIVVKVVLLGGLVALGAYNQRRLAPRLRALATQGDSAPGADGLRLRSALRAEVGLAAAVIVATAALVSYSPASAAPGVFSTSEEIGSARMELTVAPAQAGTQEVHVYLFDARTGAQLTKLDEFTLHASLPDKDLGPIEVPLRQAGPGHFTTNAATISPAGDWTLTAKLRTGTFDIASAKVELEVR